MKNITFIFLFLVTIGFSQNLENPAIIGQSNRNQKVGKGLQVEDTLLTKGKVIFSNLVTYGSADTFLAIRNGYLVRALSSGGDTTVIATKNYVNSLNGSNATKTNLNDSVTALRLLRKVDSSYLSLNAGLDSLVFTNIINGIKYRTSTLRTASGGSSSISGLTAATATNTIDNGAYSQEWQWNAQNNQPMLKLSSTSLLTSTGGDGLVVEFPSGGGGTVHTTYAGKFINNRGGGGSIHGGAYFEGIPAIQTLGNINIGGNKQLLWNNGYNGGNYITSKGNTPQFFFNSVGTFNFRSSWLVGSIFSTVDTRAELVLGLQSATRSSISFGGDNGGVNGTTYRSESVTSCIIERNLGKLLFSTNVGLSGGMANFTPTYQICVDGTNNNVAIGKDNTAGDASAKLEVVSTTQGFLPPRMTAKQASAIASPAQGLMLFVTDTNGTFTSIGWWGYGTSWKLILAQ